MPPFNRLPRHVAIIMDGNGRWAEQRGKSRVAGHRAGVAAVRDAVTFASQQGIDALTLYAFSSENWRRPQQEVSLLMELFMTVLDREVKKLQRNNIRLRIIGDITAFSDRLQQRIRLAEALTQDNTGLALNVAANYGGRWDIAEAARKLAKQVAAGELSPEQIDEQSLGRQVCLAELPPVDLLIRTGGEHRISNYLLWQVAYSELYFSPVYWPDFDEQEFVLAIDGYAQRERRFGFTGAQVRQGCTEELIGEV